MLETGVDVCDRTQNMPIYIRQFRWLSGIGENRYLQYHEKLGVCRRRCG